MNVCQPLPQSVAEGMLQIAARAICDRPGDTASQRASRTRQMVYSVLGFEPRDGLEYMLAITVVGHFHLILDSMRAALWGQMDQEKARTKTGVVSLDRAMLAFVKELRLIRHRPLAGWAEDAQRQAASGPVETPEWVAAWAGVPQPRPATPAPEPAVAPIPPSEPVQTALAQPAPAATKPASPLPARTQTPRVAKPGSHPTGVTGHQPAPTASPPRSIGGAATEGQIAAFEEALAALAESLGEALDGGPAETRVAGGD